MKNNKTKSRTKSITRTKAVEIINGTSGKFFTVTFTTKDNRVRSINCNKKTNSTTPLGYIRVYSTKDKGYRTINPKTISQLKYNNTTYNVVK